MNTINGDLNRSFQISMNFDLEKEKIREKYRLAALLIFFWQCHSQFQHKLINKQNRIWTNNSWLFIWRIQKFMFIFLFLNFVSLNGNTVKRFLDKLKHFFHHSCDIAVKWSTKKIRSLFNLKDKNLHPACKIWYLFLFSKLHWWNKTKCQDAFEWTPESK